jgi:hypothetical protein
MSIVRTEVRSTVLVKITLKALLVLNFTHFIIKID